MQFWTKKKTKRPMGHIAHLRKQFKSINTYDYIITLIKRRKKNINFMRIYFFFIWRNLNPLHPRMICAEIGWNWLIGSGEEDFLISSMYFHYFIIIFPLERAGLSFEHTYIPFTQGCFVPSLVKTGPVVLEKKIFKFRQCFFTISWLSPFGKG